MLVSAGHGGSVPRDGAVSDPPLFMLGAYCWEADRSGGRAQGTVSRGVWSWATPWIRCEATSFLPEVSLVSSVCYLMTELCG